MAPNDPDLQWALKHIESYETQASVGKDVAIGTGLTAVLLAIGGALSRKIRDKDYNQDEMRPWINDMLHTVDGITPHDPGQQLPSH